MKKVYLAKRIPNNPDSKFILNINKEMEPVDIFKAYYEKLIVGNFFVHNGPWILRPPISDNIFSENKMPNKLNPYNVWKMVQSKIESSDVYLAIIGNKSYGTIAETGYAAKCSNLAVYVLPEFGINDADLQDLWFVFQMAIGTQDLWSDEDIKMLKEFEDFNIKNVKEYKEYLKKIIPNFMK